jgi:hypothetical protein
MQAPEGQDELIESLRGILGDSVPEQSLRTLLINANNDVMRAANHFFDGGGVVVAAPAVASKGKASSKTSAKAAADKKPADAKSSQKAKTKTKASKGTAAVSLAQPMERFGFSRSIVTTTEQKEQKQATAALTDRPESAWKGVADPHAWKLLGECKVQAYAVLRVPVVTVDDPLSVELEGLNGPQAERTKGKRDSTGT